MAATAMTLGAALPSPAGQASTAAAPDWLDPSFGGGLMTVDISPGKDVAADVAVQDDGRVVVVATANWGSPQSDIYILRYLADGRPDTSFGTGGRVVLDRGEAETAVGVAIQPDGGIVVAGNRNVPVGQGHMLVARLDPAGRLDPTFAGGVVMVDPEVGELARPVASALALAADGKIVVAGTASKGSTQGPSVTRFNTDGSLDATFGDRGFAMRLPDWWSRSSVEIPASSVLVRPDGVVIVGATESSASFGGPYVSSFFTLTQFSTTGSPDAAFGDRGTVYSNLSRGTALRNSTLEAITLQPDGRIVAAGSVFHFDAPSVARSRDLAVVRYLPDGQLDPGFGAGGLVVSPAPPSTSGGSSSSGGGAASAVAVDASGRVVVGGFAVGLSTGDLAFARYTPTGALDRSFGRSGWARIAGGNGLSDKVRALALQADGRAVFAGSGDVDSLLLLGRLPAFAGSTTLTAWGWNWLGQLGDDSNSQRNVAVAVPGPRSVAVPSAGSLQSLSLEGDGTVRAWGWNRLGQLGDGTTIDRDVPVRVQGLKNATTISAGSYHSLAVSGGKVYAWGWNGVGQLGDGTAVDRHTPVMVRGLTDVVEVAAGTYHSLARLSDGTVWAWGWNALGQLGDGTTTDRRLPVQVPGIFRATAIAAGSLHSLVAAATAETLGGQAMWAWGYNGTHQVDPSDRRLVVLPWRSLQVQPVSIAAGAYHNVVLMDDGTLYTWGWNGVGQLGNGTTDNVGWPTRVSVLAHATSISAGLAHTLATDTSGRIWGWGWNALGQLGDGTTTNRLVPVPARAVPGAVLPAAGWYHSLTSVRSG